MHIQVFLVDLPDDDLVYINDQLVIGYDHANDGSGGPAYRACDVADNIATALGVQVEKVQAPTALTQQEEWTYDDVTEWLRETWYQPQGGASS